MEKVKKKLKKKNWKKNWKMLETLLEAQRTQGIEFKTWMIFLSWYNFKLILIRKMIHVIDSIPWVRCASGNVYHLFRNLVNFLSPVYEWGRGGRFGPRLDHPHKHLVVICLKAQLLLLSSSQSKGSSIAS